MPPYTTHILVEISSVHNKERLLKTAGEKYQVTYKGKFIRIMADFSAETKKTRKAWNKVLQAMKKKKKLSTKITALSKAILQNQRRNKDLLNKHKLKEFIATKPALQKKYYSQKRNYMDFQVVYHNCNFKNKSRGGFGSR
jgi:hypothetical protein